MPRASVSVVALLLLACGGAPPPAPASSPAFVSASIVPFHVTFVDGTALSLDAAGTILVDGEPIGILRSDGRIETPEGANLGALLPDGRISFEGALSPATIADDALRMDGAPVMRFTDELTLAAATSGQDAPSVPVVGATTASHPTVLFVVAVAGLLHDAERTEAAASIREHEAADLLGRDTRLRVPVDGHPVRGPDGAPVTVAVFADFQCPFSGRVQSTLTRIATTYRDRVRLVFFEHPLPFHDHARDAATVALEAYAQRGAPGFWQMHDRLFENQTSLDRPSLLGYARAIGLDLDAVQRALEQDRYAGQIDADTALAEQLGLSGTPMFAINGVEVAGAVPYETFVERIDAELAVADALGQAGVARADLYGVILEHAQATPPPPPAVAAAPARPTLDPAAVYAVPVAGAPVRGGADALVTIVEFTDFQCPFCARVQPTLEEIQTRYGRDVRLVLRHNPLPFHEHAMEAAEAAAEAYAQRGDAGFWQMHDLLFENQDALEREDLERYAQQIHLAMPRFRHALDQHTHQAAIQADQDLARRLGASGTPSFFIDGRNLRGAQPIESFVTLIDEVLAAARARVQAGTARGDLYAEILRTGATAPVYLPGAPADSGDPDTDTRVYAIPVPPGAPSRGPASARVTIQIFSDFQCPFCSRVEPTLARVLQTYGDRVRLVWRNYPLPFHDHAQLAAEAAMEVFAQRGADAFWRFHDVLFANQRQLERADLEGYAAQVAGLDQRRFRAALDDHRHATTVQADMAAVRQAGAEIGTPSCFVNGHLVQGAQPFDAFQAAIDAALAAP